jgi:hypothetical protein
MDGSEIFLLIEQFGYVHFQSVDLGCEKMLQQV